MFKLQNISSTVGITLLKGIGKLSFRWLYLLADVLFFFIYHVAGYRKKVVSQNLKNSFPEKSLEEIGNIEKKFYKHLCDVFVESVSRFKPGVDDYHNRVNLSEIEMLNQFYEKGKSVFLLSCHYGNWEWVKLFATSTKHTIFLVYNPQRNLKYDAYLNSLRAEYGAKLVPTKRIYKRLLGTKKTGELTLTLLLGDQTPKANSKFWTVFLNQETAYFPGPGKLSVQHPEQPLLFYYMDKIGRGKYKVKVEVLIEDPSKCTKEEILYIYSNRVEKLVKEKPEYYLWSHRRWKHKKPGSTKIYQPKVKEQDA